MTRRITAAVLCIGVLLGAVATAEAAFKAGTYKGKTAQNAKLSLKVLKNKKAVINFYWEGAVMSCSDEQDRTIRGLKSPSSEKFPLSKSGNFGFSAGRSDGTLEFAAQGKVKKSRATGALQVQMRINNEEQLDPNGEITCDSDLIAWSAKRKK